MKVKYICALAIIISGEIFSSFAQTWTPVDLPSGGWRGVATSADGNTLVASATGLVYSSTNGGVNWSTNPTPEYIIPDYGSFHMTLLTLASSADGKKIASASPSGFICTSTNSGVTWVTNIVPSALWYAVASSSDGMKLVAVAGNTDPAGPIYISTNAGASWLPTSAPTNHWRSVASSADGTKLIAGSNSDYLYVSTNSGISWTPSVLPTNKQWQVACSADGNKMVAAYYSGGQGNPGHLFTSTNAGIFWTSNTVISANIDALALSADGNTIVAGSEGGHTSDIFVSRDFGVTWTSNLLSSDFFNGYVNFVASSADGGKLIAGTLSGLLYISQSVSSPHLELKVSNNLDLNWTIPSTNFVLQKSSNLSAWANVTNLPTLNLTNLQNQVTLPMTSSNVFYRLKTP